MNFVAAPARLASTSATFESDFAARLHWSADQDAAVPREPLRIPELLLGALLAMEAFGVPLGPVALPLNEAGMLLLLALALCRRSRRDVSALGLTAVLAAAVLLFLAILSLSQGIPDLDWLRRWVRIAALVGLAGSVTTITAHVLHLAAYDPEAIHLAHSSVPDVLAATDDLLHRTRAERAALPYLHPGRVDVIGAGALVWARIVERVAQQTGLTEVITSEHDILDGIALSLATD